MKSPSVGQPGTVGADPVRRAELHRFARRERAARPSPGHPRRSGRCRGSGRAISRRGTPGSVAPGSSSRSGSAGPMLEPFDTASHRRRARQQRGDALGLPARRARPRPRSAHATCGSPARGATGSTSTAPPDANLMTSSGRRVAVRVADRVPDQLGIRRVDEPVDLDDRDARLCVVSGRTRRGGRARARQQQRRARAAPSTPLRSSPERLRRCISAPVASGRWSLRSSAPPPG